jgi:cyclopropane-fatty-acyl-phospholipid synthase
MFLPLQKLLSRVVRSGDLTFVDCEGKSYCFGDHTGPSIQIRLADRRTERQLALDPEMAAGEAYMTGRLIVEKGALYDFIALMMRNLKSTPFPLWSQVVTGWRLLTRRLAQFNPIPRARRNVIRHYDIDPRIYDLFLDSDLQYSCAYFVDGAGLEQAQIAKKRHIASKLRLSPGQKVLDIGSGWGGLALYLANHAGVNVTGITLSQNQIETSRARADQSELSQMVRFECKDYRQIEGEFDRIVSVGMFEHVGVTHYSRYFRTIVDHLAESGVALVHTIGRLDQPTATNPFIATYIFPGGYIPALSEIMRAVERSGLLLADIEVLRLHYAQTLKAWRERFEANRSEAVAVAGEQFCRMWEFYLAGSEAAFRYQGLVVFQLQLVKVIDALPTTRDYMLETERHLSFKDKGKRSRPRLAS